MAAKTAKATKPKACLVKGCKADAKSRGLCPGHYQSAGNQVEQGKTTWAELEKLGIAVPPAKVSNGFAEFLVAKRAAAKGNKAKSAKPKAKAKPAAPAEPVTSHRGDELEGVS